jgi:hypothetical protein
MDDIIRVINMNNKIYIQDYGVYGCIIVIASSEEEARNKMRPKSGYSGYKDNLPVESFDISEDFVYENYGDR